MHKLLFLLLPALLLQACSTGTTTGQAKDNLRALSFRHVPPAKGYEYLLHLPIGYQAQSQKEWPLILFLHGAGERGSNIWQVTVHGPPKLVQPAGQPASGETAQARQERERASQLLRENFIIIAPQCPAGQRWDNATLLALLDHIQATHRVDRSRVYLTGLSMGGYGTWSLGCRHPDRFAALAPICGGGERIDILLGTRERKAALQTLKVWAFHGAKDTAVPLSESERMVEILKKAGTADVQLTVYPEAAHDSWSASYANPKLYEWFLRHRRE